MEYFFHPIGVFRAPHLKKYELSRQPMAVGGPIGIIELEPGKNFEQALEGVEGFTRIWVVFGFHQVKGWKPKVMPTRYFKKLGLFATRCPHRPNPIGMSALRLIGVRGRKIYVQGADLIDKTPIFDIKPYIPYCDSFPASNGGWVDETVNHYYTLLWSPKALIQKEYLHEQSVSFADPVFESLRYFFGPNHYNRISRLSPGQYMMSYKTWRFVFQVHEAVKEIEIQEIVSGYKADQIPSIIDLEQRQLHSIYSAEFPPIFLPPNNI